MQISDHVFLYLPVEESSIQVKKVELSHFEFISHITIEREIAEGSKFELANSTY